MQVHPHLHRLRDATSESHRLLENITDAHKIISATPCKGTYTQLLQAHYRYHKGLQSLYLQLDKAHHLLDWPDCHRIEALEQDLNMLQATAVVPMRLNATSPAFVLGATYVAEGSCLGNQMMLKHLQHNAAFQQWGADRFLKSCGQGFGARWQHLLDVIGLQPEQQYTEMEAGAMAGFRAFGDHYHQQKNETVS